MPNENARKIDIEQILSRECSTDKKKVRAEKLRFVPDRQTKSAMKRSARRIGRFGSGRSHRCAGDDASSPAAHAAGANWGHHRATGSEFAKIKISVAGRLLAWLRLSRVRTIGPRHREATPSSTRFPEAVTRADPARLADVEGIGTTGRDPVVCPRPCRADADGANSRKRSADGRESPMPRRIRDARRIRTLPDSADESLPPRHAAHEET